MTKDYIIGFVICGLVSVIAYKKKKLTLGGALMATAFGTCYFGWGTWILGTLLLTFFGSATLTSRVKSKFVKKRAQEIDEPLVAENKPRKLVQVVANGFPALWCAFVCHFSGNYAYFVMAVAGIACATADTFSSDIGVTSKGRNISAVMPWKKLPHGESGGMSLKGSLAGLGGAVLIAVLFYLFMYIELALFSQEHFAELVKSGLFNIDFAAFFVVIISACAGAYIDSILGATVQAKYKLGNEIIEELEDEDFREEAEYYRGIRFCDNNLVNLLSCGAACFLAYLFLHLN